MTDGQTKSWQREHLGKGSKIGSIEFKDGHTLLALAGSGHLVDTSRSSYLLSNAICHVLLLILGNSL